MRVFKKMKVLILITPVLAVMFLGCATSGKSGKTDEEGATLTLTRQDTESAIAFLTNSAEWHKQSLMSGMMMRSQPCAKEYGARSIAGYLQEIWSL